MLLCPDGPRIYYPWWVTGIYHELTADGVKITINATTASQIYIVWTNIEPQLEQRWKIRRGIKIHCDPRFHLIHPRLQAEDVDSGGGVHYFTLEPWPICETRWFFFIVKLGPFWSKSNSFLYSFHNYGLPTEYVFVPHTDPGVTSSDAAMYSGTYLSSKDWSVLHAGYLLNIQPANATCTAGFGCDDKTGKFYAIRRGCLVFDTSGLPKPGYVLAAWVELFCYAKSVSYYWPNWRVALTGYNQANPGQAAAVDWNNFTGILRSTTQMAFNDVVQWAYNTFDLNSSCFPLIGGDGRLDLGIQESGYDRPNFQPDWYKSKKEEVGFQMRESGAGNWPELHVLWQPTV
jgi:hypothetical protein